MSHQTRRANSTIIIVNPVRAVLLAACVALGIAAPAGIPSALAAESGRDGTVSGLASWYGRDHQGKRTASGEPFDRNKLTAAHRSLPLGTLLRITNPANGRQVLVRVNDRGPFVGGRVLDLSETAARSLGMLARGEAWVVMEIAGPPPHAKIASAR